MADEPENLTLRLLQELRDSIGRLELGLNSLRADVDERFTDLVQRVDGNTLIFNLVAGVVHDHEQRVSSLEQDRA